MDSTPGAPSVPASPSAHPSPSASASPSAPASAAVLASRVLVTESMPFIPIGEIAFVRSLPATVEAINTSVGSIQPGEAIVTLSSGSLKFVASLPSTATGQVRVGMKAVVTVQGAPNPFAAAIASVSAAGSTAPTVTLKSIGIVPPDLVGETAQVVITIAATSGRVLAVPEEHPIEEQRRVCGAVVTGGDIAVSESTS